MRLWVALTILLSLVIVGGCALLVAHYVGAVRAAIPDGEWQCTQVVCDRYLDPAEWTAAQCTSEPDAQCSFSINGVPYRIPKDQLNLTYLSQQCVALRCTQEAFVRATNKTVPLNASTLILQ